MANAKDIATTVSRTPETAPSQNQISGVEAVLKSPGIKKRFEDILGKKAPGFISSIVSAVATNKALKLCDPMSVVSSAAIAASLDLPINQNLGFAHIVPYSGVAQFQMGWRGFVQLAMRSGQYKTMNVAEVHEGQLKKDNPFTGDMEFDAEGKKSDKVIGYVAYFRLINGFEKYLYMTTAQVEEHGRRFSKSYNSENGMWRKDFGAMAEKTVLKMLLSKFGILSIEMQRALTVDQAIVQNENLLTYEDNPEGGEVEAIVVPENEKEIPAGKDGKQLTM